MGARLSGGDHVAHTGAAPAAATRDAHLVGQNASVKLRVLLLVYHPGEALNLERQQRHEQLLWLRHFLDPRRRLDRLPHCAGTGDGGREPSACRRAQERGAPVHARQQACPTASRPPIDAPPRTSGCSLCRRSSADSLGFFVRLRFAFFFSGVSSGVPSPAAAAAPSPPSASACATSGLAAAAGGGCDCGCD